MEKIHTPSPLAQSEAQERQPPVEKTGNWEGARISDPRPLVLAELVEVESRRKKPKAGWLNRFWGYVTKGSQDECWIWSGPLNGSGYAFLFVRFAGRKWTQWLAHRLSFAIANGSVPEGAQVNHKCDNKLCVSPSHLWLGSQKDNMMDALSKNHRAFGSLNGNSKLNDEKVRAMRSIYAKGGITLKQVGAQFGITAASACSIVNRQTWRRVE